MLILKINRCPCNVGGGQNKKIYKRLSWLLASQSFNWTGILVSFLLSFVYTLFILFWCSLKILSSTLISVHCLISISYKTWSPHFGVVGRTSRRKKCELPWWDEKEQKAGRLKYKVRIASFLSPGHTGSWFFLICPYLKRTEKEGVFYAHQKWPRGSIFFNVRRRGWGEAGRLT